MKNIAICSTIESPFHRAQPRRCASALAAALVATTAFSASAQTADPTSKPANVRADVPADGDSKDIVVTARKRNELLQNVPLSVSVFGAAQLEKKNINSLRDLQHSIPGIQYSERGVLQTELTIRGVGGDSRNIGIESGVGMYVDGVYVARTSGYNSDLAEVEHIEVLRGPQGTLFGKNTIGGVINITSKKPSDKLEGMINASYGNYNALLLQAAVSVPVTDKLFTKVTFASWNRDGYIHNIYDDQDYQNENRRGGRIQLRYVANDQLEFNLSADITKDRTRTALSQVGSAAGAAKPYFNGDQFQMDADQQNSNRRDMWGTSLTANYTLNNDMSLVYIGAYRKIDVLVYSDIDQLPVDLFHSGPFTDNSKTISQEIRLVSPSSGRLRYVAGLYYYNEKATGQRFIYINGSLASGIVNDAGATTNSVAGYLNADYDIFDRLTASGGLRYTYEDKKGRFYQARTGLNYDLDNLKDIDKNLSWTGSLTYKITPRLSTYGSISKGYKSGGFNLDTIAAPNLSASDLTFKPESVLNYEIGLKGRVNNWLRFSLAGFHAIYKDKQVAQLVTTGGGSFPSVQVTNAGKARINGIEVEATFTPYKGLDLTTSMSRLNAKYTSFDRAALVNGAYVSYTGNNIERTPKWTASAGAEYRFALGTGTLSFGGNASYSGDVDLEPDNLPANFQKGYTLFDAHVAYEMANGITVSLWGKNLSQKEYRIFSRQFAGLDQVTYGEPRTFGVEARMRF
jgi:iron complex outermembrane receptor protein